MKTVLSILVVLAVPCSFGAKPDRSAGTAAQAVVLDANTFACDNCLFGMNDYYFCFEAGDKILVGHDKVRTQMKHANPSGLIAVGSTVPIRYDDQFIYLTPAGSKELKLKQDYTTRIFINNSKCRAATK